jgi:rare lipoprotein A
MRMKKFICLISILLLCFFVKAQVDTLNPDLFATTKYLKPPGKTVKGLASFYSSNLDGTKTATGEIFKNAKMTAASNSFKLNTWVRVTNLRNGKTIVVRINDRMHKKMAKKGRVVDLSRAAAKRLDFIKRGLVKVKVEQIDKEDVE